jgi:hypothetical protein
MKSRLWILAVMGLFLTAGSASAALVTKDFTSLFDGATAGNQGSTLALDGVTITAKTGMGNVNLFPNPWTGGYNGSGIYQPGWAGVAGNVYWGDLGPLGATNTSTTTITETATKITTKTVAKENIPLLSSSNYFGLGVGGPITYQQALVFDFATPQDPQNALFFGQMQSATNLSFTMSGVNGGYLKTTTTTTVTTKATGVSTTTTATTTTAADPAADNVRVFLKLAGGEVLPFDINYGAVPADGVEWNNWIRWALNQVNYADERIVGLAMEQTYGSTSSVREFGVGSITYDYAAPVPIPAAVWLLGSGLLGLIGIRRRFKK